MVTHIISFEEQEQYPRVVISVDEMSKVNIHVQLNILFTTLIQHFLLLLIQSTYLYLYKPANDINFEEIVSFYYGHRFYST